MTASADRNLLFGLLALQTGMIDQSALVAAFHAWTRDKSRSMAELLMVQGAIDDGDRSLLEGLVAKHLKRHGDDVEKSLAAIPASRTIANGLEAIGDADIAATIGHLSIPSQPTENDGNGAANETMSMGGAAGDGQRFRVLRPHARGGLGEVFVALDAELNREVALKQILDHHADDPNSRTRFVLEAEITGGLEHPGIVPVYGLGSFGDGRPYYAMRFVRGETLKDSIAAFHADDTLMESPGKRSLALFKLLRRFTDVCNAIGYAHTRGILHRDIKPANVIVGKHGETLVVDWGLAKALGKADVGAPSDERVLTPSSASGSAETLPGSAMGTPAYMSPEQAAGDLDRLGPASDVYSLGATLYCLLAGRAPFERGDLGEILRDVRKGDFLRPRQIDKSIPEALEAVCLKAMSLEPTDRYATARGLADDVERFLADEPVTALPERVSERVRRWARRNRTTVTTSAAAVLVALVGTAAVLMVQTRANGELLKANTALTDANKRELKINADLKASNDRERARFLLAMEAIKTFHSGVSDDVLLRRKEFVELRNKLLRGAVTFYGKLEKLLESHTDRESQEALASAFEEVGTLTMEIGSRDGALEARRRALAVREKLASGTPPTDRAHAEMAQSLLVVAELQAELGRGEEAKAAYERTLAILAPVVDANPNVIEYLHTLQNCHTALAMIYNEANRTSDAVAEFGKTRDILGKMVALDPNSKSARGNLANCLNNLGVMLQNMHRFEEARISYNRALEIREGLLREDPKSTRWRNQVGRTLNSIGVFLKDTDHSADAVPILERARDLREALLRENPNEIAVKRDLAICLDNLGTVLEATNRPVEGRAAFRRATEILEALSAENPNVVELRHDLALTTFNLAFLETNLDRLPEAIALYDRSRAIEAKAVAATSENGDYYRGFLAEFDRSAAIVRLATGKPEEALAMSQQAIETYRTLLARHPTEEEFQLRVATTTVDTGKAYLMLGRLPEAKRAATEGLAACRAVADAHREVATHRLASANAFIDLALINASMGESAEGLRLCRDALAMLMQTANPNPGESHAIARAQALVSHLSHSEPDAEAAINSLTCAIAAGYHNRTSLRTDPAFDSLQSLASFQLLMRDLNFPADPFAR